MSGGNGGYSFQYFEDTDQNGDFDLLFDQEVSGTVGAFAGSLSPGDYFVLYLTQVDVK